jgi:excisionase family DNA binding protein
VERKEYVCMPFLTIGEAARDLGVSRSTVYQLIEVGEIRAVKTIGTTLIEEESLDDFRASGKLT